MIDINNKKIGKINSHFLDSGAFSQWSIAKKYYEENKCGRWDYYDRPEFYQYMDDYAAFIKKYKIAIDLYANVDVIPNPELTWRNQKYLEKTHKLKPVPVVHYGTNLKWLKFYIDKKYDLIGLGGLVGNTMKKDCRKWLDDCFHLICDSKSKMPKVKIHGFGITSYKFLLRYPWWSVDSAAWDKIASFGGICVPHKRKGVFVFDTSPYIMKVSMESPERKKENHFLNIPHKQKKIIKEWLSLLQIPLGKIDKKGNVIEKGVITFHVYRRIANLFFYNKMIEHLPEWPWPFIQNKKKTLL